MSLAQHVYIFDNHAQLCQSNQYVIGGDPGDEEMWIDSDGTPYAYYEKHSLSHDSSSNQQFTDETESTFAE